MIHWFTGPSTESWIIFIHRKSFYNEVTCFVSLLTKNNLYPSCDILSKWDYCKFRAAVCLYEGKTAWLRFVNIPGVRGSRPTLWQTSCSTCRARSTESPPCCHMVRLCRPPGLSAPTVPLYSEGGRVRARWGSSSHTFPSACCRCSHEDSSARGRHSKPPDEETERQPVTNS